MSLNPVIGYSPEANRNYVRTIFKPNESPYFNMYKAGTRGIPIEIIAEELRSMNVAIRRKDVENWERGLFDSQMNLNHANRPGTKVATETGVPFEQSTLADFPRFPVGWTGTEYRFFPCTNDNKPMWKWGWKSDYKPELLKYIDAKVLSPIGWVGQNMMYQKFIVLDIDGRGHGEDDPQVIEFGNQFKNQTLCFEDSTKPGSFHLYFQTDRIIPIKHFPWAKLDLMGNADNAAVYLKNKKSNGLPLAELTDTVWQKLIQYQRNRKEIR